MIKQLKKSDIFTSPFIAVKSWELFNYDSDDTVMIESSSLDTTLAVALDYIDYYTGNPLLNRSCDILLEHQEVDDEIIYEEGISGSGKFDPNNDPRNDTGTYKSILYTQINRAFYNNYRNPTQIFGMENIDFPLSKTNRYLADDFRMFTIPQRIFGDKIVEGSVQLYDTNLDDNVVIYDDKFGNLIAIRNLFSKVQEVRKLENIIMAGDAFFECTSSI
jgi:hypothetical protein